MRLALLIVSACSLMYLESCKEVVGPVPEFQYEFSDFDEVGLTPFDTTTILVGDVEIIEGGVSNVAFDGLSSETPANLSNNAAVYQGAISPDQETYWQGQTQTSILSAISSGDATAASQLSSLETTFSNNTTLSTFLPSVTQPAVSGRLINEGKHSNSASVNTELIEEPSGIEDEVDECRQAVQDAFDAVVATLDADRTMQLTNISTRFQNQSLILAADAAAERTAASERNNTRLNTFLTAYEGALAHVTDLVSNGDLTAAEGDDLSLFILNVYALSVQASYVVFDAEIALINQAETDLLNDLTDQTDAAVASVEADYNLELTKAQGILSGSQNGCHNQGAGTGI